MALSQFAPLPVPQYVSVALHAVSTSYCRRFKPSRAKELISAVLKARLTGATYHPDNTPQQCKELSDEIKKKFKAEPWSDRYRYVVQVFLGEQKGEGIRCDAESCFLHALISFVNVLV